MGIDFLTPVDPSEVPARAGGQRVRTSAPVLDAFVESGQVVARIETSKLDATPKYKKDADGNETDELETLEEAQERKAKSMLSSLGLYAQNNKYPVKVFNRGGVVHLRRLDLNDDGSTNDWTWTPPEPKAPKAEANGEGTDETPDENPEPASSEYSEYE